jgi:hypothetical protein
MDLAGGEGDEGVTHNSDALFDRKEFYNFVMTEYQSLHKLCNSVRHL